MNPETPEAGVDATVETAGTPADSMALDPETAVRTLLAISHLTPSEEEISVLIAGFLPARAAVRMLYAVPETRYAEPALVFRARP